MQFDSLQNQIILLDGAMGTVLQQKGLPPGGHPELLNLTNPELIRSTFCAEYPEYAPDFVTFHRREVLDGEGEVFR